MLAGELVAELLVRFGESVNATEAEAGLVKITTSRGMIKIRWKPGCDWAGRDSVVVWDYTVGNGSSGDVSPTFALTHVARVILEIDRAKKRAYQSHKNAKTRARLAKSAEGVNEDDRHW